ncbi:MAG: ATP-binding protein [Pseudomonadota bacterium]
MSFRLKTILGIASIEVVLLAILVISGLGYLRQSSESELLTRGQVTAQLFATMTSDSLLSLDLATLDALVAQTLLNEGIDYVRVRNKDGIVLSEAGDPEALGVPFREDRSIKEASIDGRLDVRAPIVAAGSEFGQVEIGLSTDKLQIVIAQARRWMLTIAASEIVFVALFGIILGTVLTQQLARLREAARRVSQGEFGHQLDATGSDELADTSRSFNAMSVALADFAREVEDARARAEAGRIYAENTLNDAMNSMPQSVLIITPEQRIAFSNDAFRSSNPEAEHQSGEERPFAEVVPHLLPASLEEDGKTIPFTAEDRIERLRHAEDFPVWRAKTADGRYLMTTQQRMSDGGVVVVSHDVTDLVEAHERNRQLEMELMQTQKLESLGTMAGGIAHEINTPIQFVGDNLKFLDEAFQDVAGVLNTLTSTQDDLREILAQKLDEVDWTFVEQEVPSALTEARAGIASVGEIVRSIKEFAHPDSDAMIVQDLGKIIKNTLTVSRNQWSHVANLHCDIAEGLEEVPCHAGKLSQALINLIVNAADVLEEHAVSPATIGIKAYTDENGSAVISVSDNGPGVPQSLQQTIFDMFFTTKPPGKGTGQGLAITKRIVEVNHGGQLVVSSPAGQGATFTIMLPLDKTTLAA